MHHRRRTRGFVLALSALLAATVACDGAQPARERSVVLVVLDAAGARYFGCYGNALPATPRIDAFARGATVFERAYSQAAWTLPSIESLMTGRYPPPLLQDLRIAGNETLAQVLQREGIRTGAFSENPYVTREFGLGAGFDEFREYFPHAALQQAGGRYPRTDSDRTVDEALAWLRVQGLAPFFLYVHLLVPHAPYDPPAPFAGRFDPDYAGSIHGRPETLKAIGEGRLEIQPRDLEHLRLEYQENLAYGDQLTGRLLDGLAALGVLERSLVIVTADHGEAFREHGAMQHNTTVYEEMVHVPLVVRAPATASLPPRFAGVVELRSIFPTLCEALGLATCPKSLAPSLFARVRAAGEPAGLARTWARGKEDTLEALIFQRDKLIVRAARLETVALYDLEQDPGEAKDLSASDPERVREARSQLREPNLEVFTGEGTTVDPATRERLEALGYTE